METTYKSINVQCVVCHAPELFYEEGIIRSGPDRYPMKVKSALYCNHCGVQYHQVPGLMKEQKDVQSGSGSSS